PDMIVGGASTANGDPDNLYHILGERGSHSTAILRRARIEKKLEEGRSLLDRNEVNNHYKKVSRLVLEEVPFVHIGFSQGVVAYRSDKIKVSSNIRNRESYSLDIFEPVQ
ncbi:MAG TPA: hypothetical protein PK443_05845, partial [bacterium]|nr:hypothetical protein [bacterium]